MTTAQRVVREANQIAREFEVLGREAAVAATADHILKYWAPLLRGALRAQARAHRERFSPIALAAVERVEV